MRSFTITILCAALLYPGVLGVYFRGFSPEPENKDNDFDHILDESQNDTLNIFNDSSEISRNASQYRADEQHVEAASQPNITALQTGSTSTSSPESSTKNIPNTPNIEVEITQTEIFSNESNSTSSVSHFSGSSSTSTAQTKSAITSLGTSSKEGKIVSSTEDEEQEGVVRGQPTSTEGTNTTITKTESIYQKALKLMNDTYTLSILLPVAAGIVFASTILITIAACKCFRRQCRRRRLRRKTLPDSVKHLRPSDRARLLAESSDEEF